MNKSAYLPKMDSSETESYSIGETTRTSANVDPVNKTSQTTGESVPIFTDTFDNFLILAERVLQYDTSGELIMSTSGQTNAIQTGFNRYRTIYNKTKESPKHLDKFREIYNQCRPQIVKMDLDDFMNWFSEKASFTIVPTPKSRSKLHLTIIFRNCCRIATHIADEAEKHPDKADRLYNDPAAVYPEYFILYLLRIFYHVTDEIDRHKLINPRLKELEKNLGLSKDEDPVIGDSFSELMSAAGEIASDLGFDIPKGGMGVNNNELRQALNQITKDGSTKDTVKQFFQGLDLKNTKDFPSVISKVLNKMQETANEVPEPVRQSMNATADDDTGIVLPAQQ